MGFSCLKSYIVLAFFFLHLYTLSSEQLESDIDKCGVPALYVFGDSLVDSGNNNYLPTEGKSNFLPFGIDFEGGKPTGRYTNGKTVADYIATIYGLPLVPPYLGLSDSQRQTISTGINYASGGGGILPESGKQGMILALDNQTDLFQRTVEKDLPKQFKNPKELSKHLAESLFFINIGVNDYSLYKKQSCGSPETFARYLLDQFSIRLQRLYKLGARNFMVNNIPPAGCFPAERIKRKPNFSCNEHKNHIISAYNEKLPEMLKHLQSQMPYSSVIYSDLFKFLSELIKPVRDQKRNTTLLHPQLIDRIHPCCPKHYNGSYDCFPNSVPCASRNKHMFFDTCHPSQIINLEFVSRCFFGSSICYKLKQ